jgi:hypothetical protein
MATARTGPGSGATRSAGAEVGTEAVAAGTGTGVRSEAIVGAGCGTEDRVVSV